jgi:hypothetical protein
MDMIESLSTIFTIISIIVFFFKNNKNPNKKNVVLKTYYFSKKIEIDESDNIKELDTDCSSLKDISKED